jgi:anti-sigma-K factor RskA
MKPDQPETIDRLAAEYVLGTLRGGARRRFERWRVESPAVETRCRFWESRLSALATQIKPVRPPAHLWPQIQARLNLAPSLVVRKAPRWAIAAGVAIVALLGALLWRTAVFEGKPQVVATIAESSGVPHWSIEARGEELTVKTERAPRQPPGKAFELWALRQGGAAPVSLGLLPTEGRTRHNLTADQQMALADSMQLAVSIEPEGGSPTKLPTGPVVYTAPLHSPG